MPLLTSKSTWYVRYEVQKRYSVFYIIGSLASACAGILAFGIMHMAGKAGLGGWRWIFILEVSFSATLQTCSHYCASPYFRLRLFSLITHFVCVDLFGALVILTFDIVDHFLQILHWSLAIFDTREAVSLHSINALLGYTHLPDRHHRLLLHRQLPRRRAQELELPEPPRDSLHPRARQCR